MINREMRKVTLVAFSTGVDDYGQKRKGDKAEKTIDMVIKIYSQSHVSDIRFTDVTNIGLTYESSITDENQIIVDGVTYDVLHVIPSRKLIQVFMKKV